MFIPLRIHSEYSVVNGLSPVEAWVQRAKALNYPALALTDECNFFAAIKFYKAATAAGLKPIFGSDLQLKSNKLPQRVTLLCLNEEGFKSLTVLISKAYLEAERPDGIPVLDPSWLAVESLQGLVMLSGSLADEAELLNYQQLLSDDRFYVEISRIGAAGEERHNQQVLKLAEKHQLPVVATHPAVFLQRDDFAAHEVRVAIHDGFTLEDPNRPKRFTELQYLPTEEEMAERFADCPTALQNTVELMKRCNVKLNLGQVCLPNFSIPEGLTEEAYFRQVTKAGLEKRLASLKGVDIPTYKDRLETELDVIIKMGFTGYFLIVADFIQWAKNNGVPVGPGRGSGAGSIVAYALGITDIDPLPYDLLFERFLNPERVSMPDFDIDFCMDGRDRVIEYVAQKYGRHSVSQIITFGSMAAKAVVRDVGRVLGLPYGFVDGIAKLIPLDLGMTLELALNQEPQLKARYEAEDDVKALIDMALHLEGTVRNVGKHAGGVVIAPSNLTDFAPIYCEEGTNQLVVQYDKDDVEAAGLVKFDFLGLRNLTIIQAAVEIINQEGQAFDVNAIPLDDTKTFDLLKKGETSAVFQLESRGMKELIKRLKPDCFEDIIALVALFRPGPLQSCMVDDFIARKHGQAKIEYPHPDTAPVLKSTYGIILYQEQVMLIPQILAGYTLGGADLLRRAMGKKKPEEMAKQRSVFIEGASKNNIPETVSGPIFDLMEKFAGYGFNKSHSAAYAMVAYQTAYLKAHYPAEFMAAVLSSDMDNTDKVVGFVEECKAMHLQLLPPDIQQSNYSFSVVDNNTIRYGLGAIKGVGQAAIDLIIKERAEGEFKNLFDFCKRLDLRKVNKRVLEALVYSGAMDGLGPNRSTLLASIEVAMQGADQHNEAKDAGQHDLFGAFAAEELPEIKVEHHWKKAEDWSTYDRVMFEKQVLGWCLSGHPLEEYRGMFKDLKVIPVTSLSPTARGEAVMIAGIVTDLRRIKTKRGGILTVLKLEDFSGKIEVTCFAEIGELFKDLMKTENMLVVECEISFDDFSGGLRAVAKTLHDLHDYQAGKAKLLKLKVNDAHSTQTELLRMKEALHQHPGKCPVELVYEREDGLVHFDLGQEWLVLPNTELLDKLNAFDAEVVF